MRRFLILVSTCCSCAPRAALPVPTNTVSHAVKTARVTAAPRLDPLSTPPVPGVWAETLESFTLVHETDRLGHWITVEDDDGTELCMFDAGDDDRPVGEEKVAELCEWGSEGDEL